MTAHAAPTDLRSLLGEAVFLAAAEQGYTQAALAEAVGVSTKHMSLSLRGKGGSPDFYDRCADALGMTWKVALT